MGSGIFRLGVLGYGGWVSGFGACWPLTLALRTDAQRKVGREYRDHSGGISGGGYIDCIGIVRGSTPPLPPQALGSFFHIPIQNLKSTGPGGAFVGIPSGYPRTLNYPSA